jgi:hypothetical protein
MSGLLLVLTEEQFEERYELLDNHIDTNASFDGKMFETFGEEIDFVLEMEKQNRVITIVESDSDITNEDDEVAACMYYISGYHVVNRIGYLITAEPIKQGFEVKLDW